MLLLSPADQHATALSNFMATRSSLPLDTSQSRFRNLVNYVHEFVFGFLGSPCYLVLRISQLDLAETGWPSEIDR